MASCLGFSFCKIDKVIDIFCVKNTLIMASSVFFRFKSQKEPSRVAFDGTGISVFELKKEIIALNRLGDGTDFELLISSEDTNEGKSCRYSTSILAA